MLFISSISSILVLCYLESCLLSPGGGSRLGVPSVWIVQNQIWILIPFAVILKGKVVPGKTRGEFSLMYNFPDCSPIVWGCRFYSPLACYPYRGIRLPRWWFVPLTGSELPPVATLPGVRLKSFRFRLLSHSSPSVPVPALVPGSPSVKV
jgi:hypothetical protein